MEIIQNKYKRIIAIMLVSIMMATVVLPVASVFAATVYTSSLKKGDTLKFTGGSWSVYTTKEAAKNLDSSKRGTYLKTNDKITIQEIEGNVLKIANNKYIYYGSTASSNFTNVSKTDNVGDTGNHVNISGSGSGEFISVLFDVAKIALETIIKLISKLFSSIGSRRR